MPAIRHYDTDSVDDNLQQQLDLNAPPEEDSEVERETLYLLVYVFRISKYYTYSV
jgi:hypothetical protein